MSTALRRFAVHVADVSAKTRWIFVELTRDDGAVGTGEASLNGSEAAVASAAGECAPLLWSCAAEAPDTFAAAALPATLAHAAIVSAIDLALWDLYAQDVGMRLVDALGGARRPSVPMYANINRRTTLRTPEAFAASARDALAAGYGALKIAPFDEVVPTAGAAAMNAGLARIAAVRALAGPGCRLMIDCHWRFDETTASRMIDAAAEHAVHWIECPLPESEASLAQLVRLRAQANARGILLAGMEQGIGAASFRPFCEAGAYDVMMPDVKYIGGLGEMLRCGEALARHGVAVSPHNPTGPVAHAASLHVSAALDSLDMLEMQFDESPLFDELVAHALPQRAGALSALPATAGLGVRLDAQTLATHRSVAPRVWEAE